MPTSRSAGTMVEENETRPFHESGVPKRNTSHYGTKYKRRWSELTGQSAAMQALCSSELMIKRASAEDQGRVQLPVVPGVAAWGGKHNADAGPYLQGRAGHHPNQREVKKSLRV